MVLFSFTFVSGVLDQGNIRNFPHTKIVLVYTFYSGFKIISFKLYILCPFFFLDVFFSLCLVLMVGSLLETIFITYLLNNASDFSPVPQWVQAVFLNFLGCLVCMPRRNKKPKDSGM